MPDDYILNVTSGTEANPVLQEWAKVWGGDLNPVQLEQLEKGGFYEAEPAPGLRVLSLNTVIYSRWHACKGSVTLTHLDGVGKGLFFLVFWFFLGGRVTRGRADGGSLVPPSMGGTERPTNKRVSCHRIHLAMLMCATC